jgi:hypothetical protein
MAACYNTYPTTFGYGYPSWEMNTPSKLASILGKETSPIGYSTGYDRFSNYPGFNNVTPYNTWGVPAWTNEWAWNVNRMMAPTTTGFNNTNMYNIPFRPCHPIEYMCLTNPIRVLNAFGDRMVWLCYEVKGFKPEEVTVTLNKTERSIIVEANSEMKEGKEHHVMRKFYRKFCFPETLAKIDMTKCELKASFNAEGFVTIECQLPRMTAEELAKCPSTMLAAAKFDMPPNFVNYFNAPTFGGFNNYTSVPCKAI